MSFVSIINLNIYDLFIVLFAYMVGGISAGYLLVRFIRGVDVRSTGSGGLGARNVGRILGRRGFYLTLFADILKGAVIVGLARWIEFQPMITGAVVVAVIAGHIWPIGLQFRGGKGIATCLGAFVVFNYIVLLIGGSVFAFAYIISRKFLQSWVLAFLTLPPIMYLLESPMSVVVPLLLSTTMVIYAHKENIKQAWLS